MIIRARAPLRLGLAGGGSDVSPYCDAFGGHVLNATIDKYAYAVLRQTDKAVIFTASDYQATESHEVQSEPYSLTEGLSLHRAVYNVIVSEYNNGNPLPVELSTFCDAPAGSGLGSSSTLVVAMVKAFSEYLNLPLDDYHLSRLAYRIERIECQLQGGRQDQYSAAFGGFNFMEFYENNRAVINSLRVKEWIICELEASLVLFYTGKSRSSAAIISDQSNSVSLGEDALQAMHEIKKEASIMKEGLLTGDFRSIVESMRDGWESKKRSSTMVSNPMIDKIYNSAIEVGALAGKVSGAGGGGFMLFFVPADKRMALINLLGKFNGQVTNCHFTPYGAQAWRVP